MSSYIHEHKATLVDIGVVLALTTIAIAVVVSFQSSLKSLTGFPSILWTALAQFSVAGLGPVIVMLARRERFEQYGLVKENVAKSLSLGMLCIAAYVLYVFVSQGTIEWMPFRMVTITRPALQLQVPLNVLGILLIAASWGFFEGFTLLFASKKIDSLAHRANPFLKPGPLVVVVLNILVHLSTGHTIDASWIASAAVIYVVLIIPELTRNSWGSVLIFFALWNAM